MLQSATPITSFPLLLYYPFCKLI